jgi:trehalose 2-sulfotransferase
MPRANAQYESPPAVDLMPPDLAASRAESLHALRTPVQRRDVADTETDGLHDRHLQLVPARPQAWLSDQSAHATPKSCFFICFTRRSGSTLLCDALSSTDVAGYAEEYFPERFPNGEVVLTTDAALKDPDTWRSDWTRTPFEECLQRVLTSGTTPNGVFASKVKWFNMPYLNETLAAHHERGSLSLAERLDRLFPNLRYVWITRRDKVRQAVSLAKASQSRQWRVLSADPQCSNAVDYNFRVVDLALRWIVDEECAWEDYFTHAGIAPFTVVYEDLSRDYESTVGRLLDHLDIDLPSEYVFPPPRLHKQADAISEEWVERYNRDARSSRRLRTAANLPALLVRRRLRETYLLPRLRTHINRLWVKRGS